MRARFLALIAAPAPILAMAPLLATVLTAVPVGAVPGGDLTVLPKGHYTCEIPGDPSDPVMFAGKPQPDADFDIVGDSSYRVGGVRGIYLMTGDMVRFTTGPLEGKRYHRVNTTFLRTVGADGKDGDLRCVNSIQAQAPEPAPNARCRRAAAKAEARKVAIGRREDTPAC